MKESVQTLDDPAVAYGLSLPGQGVRDSAALGLVVLLVTSAVAVSAYYLVQALPWLFWPVVILAALWLFAALLLIIDGWRNYLARTDTATSTIRGASQGAIEIVGRVKAIEGQTLVSPINQIPCVHYRASVSCPSINKIVVNNAFFQEQAGRALLIDDGTGEAFAPSFANTFNDQLLNRFEASKLPRHLHDRIRSNPDYQGITLPRGSCNLDESLMPVGITAQVNAILVTIKASDSYIGAWTRLGNDLEILLSPSQRDRIDTEWRAYADTFLAQADAKNKPAPLLNALVPFTGTTSFTLTYRPKTKTRFVMGNLGFQLIMSIAPTVLILMLFGWISHKDLWPFG